VGDDSVRKLADFQVTDTDIVMSLWVDSDQAIEASISFDRRPDNDEEESGEKVGQGPEAENVDDIDDIFDVIEARGIDVDTDRVEEHRREIEEAMKGARETRRIRVARGRKPVDGADARLEWADNLGTTAREEDDDSTSHAKTAREGQTIAIYHPVTPARPGEDVFGKQLSAKEGREKEFKAGDNVVFDEETNHYISQLDGLINVTGKQATIIQVDPVFRVGGDLNHNIGNIDFCGDLSVSGDVSDGLKVSVEGDMEIMGTVGGAVLEAGGDVKIHGGVAGKQKAALLVDGELSAKYLSECPNVKVGGDIKVDAGIRNCQAGTGGRIDAEKTKIQGGRVMARDSVAVGTLGSPMGVDTTIIVGFDYTIYREIESLRDEMAEQKSQLDKLTKSVEQFENHLEQVSSPSEKKLERLEKNREQLIELQHQRARFENRLKDLKKQLYPNHDAHIKVVKKLHAGVDVQIGRETMQIDEEHSGVFELRVDEEQGAIDFFSST
jgi:uncharacterized protein (DUF342 family)